MRLVLSYCLRVLRCAPSSEFLFQISEMRTELLLFQSSEMRTVDADGLAKL